MKPLNLTLLLILVSGLATAHAKTQKTPQLPAVFKNARYVYVEAVDGQALDLRLDTEDRQAIADVTSALYGWERYSLTMERGHADLIFVVRRGRLAESRVGAQTGSTRQGAPSRPANSPLPGNGVAVGGSIGPPDDLLEVYMPNPANARGTLIWRRTLADGLTAPELALLKQLKDEVESTYPKQATSTASKP